MYIGKNALFVLEKLKQEIFSKEIILKYRNSKTDFTRNRKQPFGQMLLFMFNLVKKSCNYSVHLKKNIVINNFFSVFKKTAILLTVLITYW